MTAYKLQPVGVKERDRQADIIRYLRQLQVRGKIRWFIRINGGSVAPNRGRVIYSYRLYLPKQPSLVRGLSDLLVVLADGRLMALEIKQPGYPASDEQNLFLATIKAGGGIAEVVHSFEEVEALFNATQ